MKYKYAPYSHSKINTYLNCPLSFKYGYLMEKEITGSQAEFQVGSGLHSFLEKYQKALFKIGQEMDYDIGDILLNEVAERYVKRSVRADIIETGLKVLDWFTIPKSEDQIVISFENKIALDKNFKKCPYESDKAFVRSIVDRYMIYESGITDDGEIHGNKLIVIDFKFWRKPDIKPDIQLYLYAWILYNSLADSYDLSPEITIEIWNMRYQKIEREIVSYEKIESESKKFIDNISVIEKDEKFDGRLGEKCLYCNNFPYCEAVDRSEGGSKLVSQYLEAKSKASKTEKELKEYILENGNIDVSGKMFGHFKKDRVSFDGEEVYNYLVSIGGSDYLRDKFHLNATDMKWYAKKLNFDFDECKNEFGTVKQINSFGFLPEEK